MKNTILFFLIFALLFLFVSSHAFGQETIIQGQVIDASNGEPLKFVSIYTPKGKTGTTSDISGKFKLEVQRDIDSLHFSCVGYKEKKKNIEGNKNELRIHLSPNKYEIQEVRVYARNQGNLNKISSYKADNKLMREQAGITKDILRATQMMPGVSSNNAASAKYNVRGGSYDENIVLVNDTRVKNPFHLQGFPITSVGVFNIDMANRINFSSGGFSAEYGDALSSLLKIDYREGSHETISGKADLSLVDMSALIEGPVSEKGSFIFGARRSYVDYAMNMFNLAPEVYIRYYDLQGSFNYSFDNNNHISILFIHSKDNLGRSPTLYSDTGTKVATINNEQINYIRNSSQENKMDKDYSNNVFSIKSNNKISENIINKTVFSIYEENLDESTERTETIHRNDFEGHTDWYENYNQTSIYSQLFHAQTYSVKNRFKMNIGEFYMKTGFKIQKMHYKLNTREHNQYKIEENISEYPDTVSVTRFPSENNDTSKYPYNSWATGGFIQGSYHFLDNVIINAGIRADYLELNEDITFDPRISLSWQLHPKLEFNAAWGIFHQSPRYRQLPYADPDSTETKIPDTQEAIHYIGGIKYQFSLNF